jgi:triacylglycerol lipase
VLVRAVVLLLLLFGECRWPFEASAPPEWPGDAGYSVPLPDLDGAVDCRGDVDGSGRAQPVLLVHGTGVTREQNWGWGYWPALGRAGFEVCWLALPDKSYGDIQVSAEYVARAVELMARWSGDKVDIVGHSQGGLTPRWAIKYFPSGAFVDDYVGFASPNHGTVAADAGTARRECFEACWQMRRDSDFITALNAGDETPGPISYTSIYTQNDELVRPIETAALLGARNVRLQDVCAGRPVDHLLIAGDAVTWHLAIDALTHPGPADPDRLPGLTCLKLALPGATFDWPRSVEGADTHITDREPALQPYAR